MLTSRCRLGVVQMAGETLRTLTAAVDSSVLQVVPSQIGVQYKQQRQACTPMLANVVENAFNDWHRGLGVPLRVVREDEPPEQRLTRLKREVAELEQQLKQSQELPSHGDGQHQVPADLKHTLPNLPEKSGEGEEYTEVDRLTRRLKRWWIVQADQSVPYDMMQSFQLYPQWMPFCTKGTVSASDAQGAKRCQVTFGISAGALGTIGDEIDYAVTLEPPSPNGSRVYTNSENSKYADRLSYDWRFFPIEGGTQVILEVEFVARSIFTMPVWEALRGQVVNGIAESFMKRVKHLHAAGHGMKQPAFPSVSAVKNGPLLKDQPVVIVESDGRTIRNANSAFCVLTGHYEQVEGQQITTLLQGSDTDRGVLAGLRAAINQRLPAIATVRNYKKDNTAFLNRIRLAPLTDDENPGGKVVYWAILSAVEGDQQRLELTSTTDPDDKWGPDYEHPKATLST